MTQIPTYFIDPARPKARFRPGKALHHFRILLKDKEDTKQVAAIFEALPRKRFMTQAQAFCASVEGQALMASQPYLPPLLDDHETLLKLPEGTVGREYVKFMRSEGLSAAGLVEDLDKFGRQYYDDQFQWYANRQRDTHDLCHVLTGYGRDALGELSVLAFTYGQDGSWGSFMLSWAGSFELKRRVKTGAPVYSAVAEGQRNGTAAMRIFNQDIRALLAEPIEVARKRMNIASPLVYRQAHEHYRTRGIDPYDFFASAVPA